MDTRAVKRRAVQVQPSRIVYKQSVDLSDEEDRFWGVHTPKVDYIYLDHPGGPIMLADYRKVKHE